MVKKSPKINLKSNKVIITLSILILVAAFLAPNLKKDNLESLTGYATKLKNCEDGTKDFYVKGSPHGTSFVGGSVRRTDYCATGNHVGEYYCSSWRTGTFGVSYKIIMFTSSDCPHGCKDGACLREPEPVEPVPPEPTCTPTETPEISCTDGLDNDCDGKTDSADNDCITPILDFGGMFGEAHAQRIPNKFPNPVTTHLTCPDGYTATQIYEYFLTPYSDWPLTFCHKKFTGTEPLDFGGMYSKYLYNTDGYVNEYPNPATGDLSCPAGYKATQLLGANGWDNKLVFCHRPSTTNKGELFFGGMYSAGYNNPITGDKSCPTDYTSSQVMYTRNMDRYLYFCYFKNPTPTPVVPPEEPECTPTETPEATCDDGLDNDCDTLIDSADSDCLGQVLENGLVAKWTFNLPKTTAVFAFDMIGEHHGTGHNTAQRTDSFEIAEFARSYDFNGVDSYVEVPDSPEISGGNKDLTVSVWFKLRNIPTTGGALHIISKTLGATHKDYYIDIVNSKLAFGYENDNDWDNSGSGIPGTTTLSINTWYNGVFTYDLSSKALKLYLNGNLENSWTLPADLPDTTAPLLFGKSGGFYNRPVDVIIDEVSIYSRTLSDIEVAGLYSLKPSIEKEPISLGIEGDNCQTDTDCNTGLTCNINKCIQETPVEPVPEPVPEPVQPPVEPVTPEPIECPENFCQYTTSGNLQVCLPIGVRVSDTNNDNMDEYCDGVSLVNQKFQPTACTENYECESNICSPDNKCINYATIRKIYCWALEQTGLLDNLGYTDYNDCLE